MPVKEITFLRQIKY